MTEGAPLRSQADILRMIDNMLQRAAGVESPAEAESLAAKAQQLMTKYAIDEAVLAEARRASGKTGEPEKIVAVKIELTGIFRKDLAYLVAYLADLNDCRAVFTDVAAVRPHRRVVTVIGFASDVKRVVELNALLGIQRQRALNAFMTATYGGVTLAKMTAFKIRREFIHSFAHGVNERLRAARDAARGAADAQHGATSVAVAVRSKDNIVEAALTDMFPNCRTEKRRISGGSASARAAGLAAGRSADVGQDGLGGRARHALGR